MVLASRADEAQRWLATASPDIGKARPAGGDLDPDAFMRGARAGAAIQRGAALPEGRGRALGAAENNEESETV